jgi:hypothetical protein
LSQYEVKGIIVEIQAVSSVATTITQSQPAGESVSSGKAGQVKKGGPPPSGGAKPAAASTSTNSSANSISNTAKVYDKRDADQDGTVSYQEELLYSLKYPTEETNVKVTVSASQIKAGLKAYQQGQ